MQICGSINPRLDLSYDDIRNINMRFRVYTFMTPIYMYLFILANLFHTAGTWLSPKLLQIAMKS
jgi:hypothetical protein